MIPRATIHAARRFVERIRPDLSGNLPAAMVRLQDAILAAEPGRVLESGAVEWRVPRNRAPGATRRERDRNRIRLCVEPDGAVATVLGAFDRSGR